MVIFDAIGPPSWTPVSTRDLSHAPAYAGLFRELDADGVSLPSE